VITHVYGIGGLLLKLTVNRHIYPYISTALLSPLWRFTRTTFCLKNDVLLTNVSSLAWTFRSLKTVDEGEDKKATKTNGQRRRSLHVAKRQLWRNVCISHNVTFSLVTFAS